MPIDDFLDPAQEARRLKKAQQRAWVSGGTTGGDSNHPGTGADSIALGDVPIVSGDEAVGIGPSVYVTGSRGLGLGAYATVEYDNSAAVGNNAGATAAWQIMLGTSFHTVVVPGTFSNPSARRLKRNIEPAPDLGDVFPALYEWEYIEGSGCRHIGPIADELVGTDAERFLTYDGEGRVAGIQTLALAVVQIARLHAELDELRAEVAALKKSED